MPTIDIPDKICQHCGGIRWVYNSKQNRYDCTEKVKERHKNWRLKNVEKLKEIRRIHYHTKVDKILYYKKTRETKQKNPEKYKAHKLKYSRSEKGKSKKKEYRSLHHEEHLVRSREYKRKGIINLNDSYIKELLIRYSPKIKYKDVPQELVELKRKERLLKIQLKNQTNEQN